MAEKRINPLVIGGVITGFVCLSLVMYDEKQTRYEPVEQLPGFDPELRREDGDTQTDTIKALQAYAREAVEKADSLLDSTQQNMTLVLENQQGVSRLAQDNSQTQQNLQETNVSMDAMAQRLLILQRELSELRTDQDQINVPVNVGGVNQEGLPLGFGFDDEIAVVSNPNQGEWYDPIDRVSEEDGEGNRFSGLLSRPDRNPNTSNATENDSSLPEITIEPIYTIPKDATLTDGVALTALIGRIPVEGQTPDPYPVKIYIGKENLLANGHDLPEIEGMIFSGLGFGDWNLSCVSARLTSATFIFEDGSIVNHTSQGQSLGYISDPSGIPCVAGRFVTNAPMFLAQRVGLAGLGAAGSAYADAQQERSTSLLTGSTTSTVIGDINKLASGDAVQSATEEVSQWLLARQRQSFDAVVVNPGVGVSIHLEQSLPLDRISTARRIRYAQSYSDSTNLLD
ncbi:MAG: TIGR03752 family integrating conjugative element protein [Proteobacteria bacterium]|nr:TIGR03752 family integrating conjugative element protein [Pseudomonadota bacterium]